MINLFRRKTANQQPARPGAITFEDWVHWAEARIATVATGEQLDLRVSRVVRGPMTVTFVVKLAQPNPANLRRIKSLGPSFAQALGLPDIRVDDTAAGIQIELPSPAPRTPDAAWLAQHTAGMSVAIGMDSQRQPIRINLDDHPSLFFVGPTRHGKTEGAKSALYALLAANPSLQAIILGRRQDWLPLASLPGVLAIVGDANTSLAAAAWLAGEVATRTAQDQISGPPYIIIADDLPVLLKARPEIARHLGDIAGAGGAVRCYLIAITQFAGSNAGDGGAALASNTTARVVYACASAAQAALATGVAASGADKLSGHKGDALLICNGAPVRCTTAHLPEDFSRRQAATGQGSAPAERLPWRQNGIQNGQTGDQNGLERGRTAQNGQNAATSIPPTTPDVNATPGRGAPTRSGRSESFQSFQATDDDQEMTDYIEGLRAALPYPRPAPGPLLHPAPPCMVERAILRELYRLLGSKDKVYFAAWGFKSGKTHAWLTQALTQQGVTA